VSGVRMAQVQLTGDCSQLLAVTVPSKRGTNAGKGTYSRVPIYEAKFDVRPPNTKL